MKKRKIDTNENQLTSIKRKRIVAHQATKRKLEFTPVQSKSKRLCGISTENPDNNIRSTKRKQIDQRTTVNNTNTDTKRQCRNQEIPREFLEIRFCHIFGHGEYRHINTLPNALSIYG